MPCAFPVGDGSAEPPEFELQVLLYVECTRGKETDRMRAVLMTAVGGPEVLELAELPEPDCWSGWLGAGSYGRGRPDHCGPSPFTVAGGERLVTSHKALGSH